MSRALRGPVIPTPAQLAREAARAETPAETRHWHEVVLHHGRPQRWYTTPAHLGQEVCATCHPPIGSESKAVISVLTYHRGDAEREAKRAAIAATPKPARVPRRRR